jgi:hypothetical protein
VPYIDVHYNSTLPKHGRPGRPVPSHIFARKCAQPKSINQYDRGEILIKRWLPLARAHETDYVSNQSLDLESSLYSAFTYEHYLAEIE